MTSNPIYGKIKFMFQTTNQIGTWGYPMFIDFSDLKKSWKNHESEPAEYPNLGERVFGNSKLDDSYAMMP